MPRIELQRALSVPAVPARSALSTILHDVVDERGDWADFALYLNFGALGLPDVGYVAIPVIVSDLSESIEPRHEIKFKLHARRSRDAFPTFDGGTGIDAEGPSSSQLWLAGSYDVPMKSIGALFDKTFARGTAEKSLHNMLNELAQAVIARVEKRELAYARYRLVFNSGD